MTKEIYKNIKILKQEFRRIHKLGIVESLRNGYGGVGYTFEKLLGKEEDGNSTPDFLGIEIKTRLKHSRIPLTLFSMNPRKDECKYATKWLVENFGYISKKHNKIKLFREELSTTEWIKIYNNNRIKLQIDEKEDKIRIIICDLQNNLVDDSIYWNLKDLENRLKEKLSYMALIIAESYNNHGTKYFSYEEMRLYVLKSFKNFVELIKEGKIKILINVDINLSGKYMGQIHDHGPAFRIEKKEIYRLFNRIYINNSLFS